MILNYFKIAFRTLFKNKVYSFINMSGLAMGTGVAMLIGLWIYDELNFDKYHTNYEQIAQVGQRNTLNNETNVWPYLPIPLANELRNNFPNDLRRVVLSTFTENHILAFDTHKFMKNGNYMEPDAPEMFSLKMIQGSAKGLQEPYSILLSASVAKAYFGNASPIGKIMKVDNQQAVKVTGVYQDLPYNSSLNKVSFILPWSLLEASDDWVKKQKDDWRSVSYQVFVQLAPNTDFKAVADKIRPTLLNKIDKEQAKTKPALVLHPMSQWHLHQFFKNGVFVGGSIDNVWLFGFIGVFVLLLACINFMNLSTARSEKRAREVGVRKAIGSFRSQLIIQFFSESLLMVVLSFVLGLLLVQSILPFFNQLTGKEIHILWSNPAFWAVGVGFSLFAALLAGSYPAFYLSSFMPVKVLKGTFKTGKKAAIPRQLLVVFQFTVSITMIVGTVVVFRQIQFANNRPIGYSREGLIMVKPNSNEIHSHFEAVKNELLQSGAVIEMAESVMPATKVLGTAGDFEWKGKDPTISERFPIPGVSYNYGKTVGWQFREGRDFSKDYGTDSSALILNESAMKFMNLGPTAIGEVIRWSGKPYHVIGVIKDMIMESPYAKARPSVFYLDANYGGIVNLRINPTLNANEAVSKIESVFRKYNPAVPFEYQFVAEEYTKKFAGELQIGQIAGFFAMLAIIISCLGLFGLASFIAEQRTKELGIRKTLGATVYNLWQLLSKDFVWLVSIAMVIATPLAYYLMQSWLQKYDYRTGISWWVFVASGLSVLIIALLTVSYQALKAALMNPVKSLKSE